MEMSEINKALKSGAHLLIFKPGFPLRSVSILFNRVVGLDSSLDVACNMEEGRHDVRSVGWLGGWLMCKIKYGLMQLNLP